MDGLKKAWYAVDTVLFKLVWIVIFLTMSAMVIVATINVFTRYVFSMPMRWSNEFCCFMLVYDVFLGAAIGIRNAEHVRLDVDKLPLSKGILTLLNVIATVAVYVFLFVFLIYGTRFMIMNGAKVTEVMKWPYYVLYCILPISGILMLIGQTTVLLKKTDKKEVARA